MVELLKNIFAITFLAAIFCHVARAVPFIHDEVELETNSAVQLIGIESVTELMKQDPNLIVEELTPTKTAAQSIVYTLGRRVHGDKLVGHVDKAQSWSTPQNVKILISYPAVGLGAKISFIYILVSQDSPSGRAYIIRGGLGQRYITVAVEGYNTAHMNYSANIFGVL